MTQSNIETFDLVVGKVFARLYENFPLPTDLIFKDVEDVKIQTRTEEGENWAMFFADLPQEAEFFNATVDWLAGAGYLTCKQYYGGTGYHDAVLTSKGLEVLKAIPSSLQSDLSIGEKLTDASKAGAKSILSNIAGEALSIGARMVTTHFGLPS